MDLTKRELQVYNVLGDTFQSPYRIADAAGLRTTSPKETASRYCIRLVSKGFAEKGGTPMFPEWRRAPAKGPTP